VDAAMSAGSGSFTHYIGEPYGGGIIIELYKDANGDEHGLILDLSDKVSARAWSAVTTTSVPASGAASLWNGFANSNAIRSQNNNSAGADCRNSTNGGYTDWFLPAIDQVSLIYGHLGTMNMALTRAGGNRMSFSVYWSSSEHSSTRAHMQDFGSGLNVGEGNLNNINKTNLYNVRCIRAF